MSAAYGGGETQRLLSRLLHQPAASGGQNLPAAADASDAAPAPAPPRPNPPSSQFSANMLSDLLGLQDQSSPSSGLAAKIIKGADSNGDGQLSADEITAALSQKGASIDSSTLTAAVGKLDTNSDGQLSQTELANALDAKPAHHRHGHHHPAASSSGLAQALVQNADADNDGALSADEVQSALGGGTSTASASSAFEAAFKALDSDGDGKLQAQEIAAGLQSLWQGHEAANAPAATA